MMAPTSTALTTKVENGSPYQLSSDQTLKASQALLKHIKAAEASSSSKPNLLAGTTEDEEQHDDLTPIWLTLTTKQHISPKKQLKPARLAVPHPLNTSSTSTICLIVADPQRTYKDLVASPAFPSSLGGRITRVIGLGKLQVKYKQYENQRQLFASHDIFLADDRVITQVIKALGKTFYKSTSKRPIPVILSQKAPKGEDKKTVREKDSAGATKQLKAATPQALAKEIERAIQSAVVHLSPSTNTAVRVGYSSWDAEKLAENVEAVSDALIEKYVTKKWRGVRAIHIKGPETAALPIWLADELWVNEDDVIEDRAALEATWSKKRKAEALEAKAGEPAKIEGKKQKLLESNDDNLDKEIAARKEKLKKQKAEAASIGDDDVPKPTKAKKAKMKKAKAEVGA